MCMLKYALLHLCHQGQLSCKGEASYPRVSEGQGLFSKALGSQHGSFKRQSGQWAPVEGGGPWWSVHGKVIPAPPRRSSAIGLGIGEQVLPPTGHHIQGS